MNNGTRVTIRPYSKKDGHTHYLDPAHVLGGVFLRTTPRGWAVVQTENGVELFHPDSIAELVT